MKGRGKSIHMTYVSGGLVIALLVGGMPAGTTQGEARSPLVVAAQRRGGDVICQLKPGRSAFTVARRHNLNLVDDLEDDFYVFSFSAPMTTGQAISSLRADPDVRSAEPNYWVRVPEVEQRSVAFLDQRSVAFLDGVSPSDYFGQYAMTLIRAPEAHALAQGEGVTVAIIDTGVDRRHPALAVRRFARGSDFVDKDENPAEVAGGMAYGHGTMVTGIVALMAPRATLMPLRAFDPDGMGKISDVAVAIRWAVRHGADVINMSFGVPGGSTPAVLRAAIDYATRRGVVLVASAGNDNTSSPEYPASDEDVLAVAATDSGDVKASFSNYGSHIDVSAPGVSIYSAFPGGRFGWGSGTSYAAAFVSGEAALVLSAGRSTVREAIVASAVNIDRLNPGFAGLLGRGRIDALGAVRR
jgi:subtilisin family serine protease